jgi:hypothetical protein
MFGSMSANVAVLTLTPDRPHRFATGAFIRADWPSMTGAVRSHRRPIAVERLDPRGGQLFEKRSRALG